MGDEWNKRRFQTFLGPAPHGSRLSVDRPPHTKTPYCHRLLDRDPRKACFMSYGEIHGVAVGAIFSSRRDLYRAGVHRDIQRGIIGHGDQLGAESLVLSDGYEDDADFGDLVFYTGDGGRDPRTRRQVRDQQMTGRNATLALNVTTRQPVRLIRSVINGYRYDGMFSVEEAWLGPGKAGLLICRFRLRRVSSNPPSAAIKTEPAPPHRRPTTVYRLVRDTQLASSIKALYSFRCQMCRELVATAAGPYAEAAHIVPLGGDYGGLDVRENILCLCPNDHARFDHGGIYVLDDFALLDLSGPTGRHLLVHPSHQVSIRFLREHRRLFGR